MTTDKFITYVNDDAYSTEAPNIGNTDPFRKATNLFWHNKTIKKTVNFTNKVSYVETDQLLYSNMGEIAEKISYVIGDPVNIASNLWPEQKQTIQIYSEDEFANDQDWRDYVLGNSGYSQKVQTDTQYYDLVHQINLPLAPTDLETLSSVGSVDVVSVSPEYNFYVQEYEKKIAARLISENSLPYLYSYVTMLLNDNLSAAQNIISYGRFKKEVVDFLKNKNTAKSYFKNFSKESIPPSISFKNIFFVSKNAKSLMGYNDRKHSFPMFSETILKTDPLVAFSNILLDSSLSSDFMKSLYNSGLPSTPTPPQTGRYNPSAPAPVETSMVENFVQNVQSIDRTTTELSRRRVFDITAWLQNYQQSGPQPMDPTCVMMGLPSGEVGWSASKNSTFSKQMSMLTFIGKARKYVETYARNFVDCLAGKVAQSEIIAYKISKYKNGNMNSPIQNIWFFNTEELDVIEYIDTQLKYNNQYTYEIYAYNFVVGAEYMYTNLAISRKVSEDCIQLFDVKTNKPVEQKIRYRVKHNAITAGTTLIPVGNNPKHIAEVDVALKPCLKVVETLIYSKTFKMLDSPPLPPNVNFIPYIGIKDKITVQFEGSIGSQKAHPIALSTADEQLFREMKANRYLGPKDPILFEADDYPVLYNIYRLTEKPNSYQDFRNNLRATVDLRRGQLLQKSAAIFGTLDDKILPNQKYYYTLTCLDVHNNISNPSPIYEIEVVEDKGAIYLVYNVIELKEFKPYVFSKPMRRFFYLVPTIGQSVINEAKSNFDNYSSAKDLQEKIILGLQDESVWGRDIKMRLTSKKTGKKVDINLNFKLQHIKSNVEKE